MKIIEQGYFLDLGPEETEKRVRAWRITRYSSFSTQDAAKTQEHLDFENCVIKSIANLLQLFRFTVLDIDYAAFPQQTGMPKWKHAGAHAKQGKLYWNRFKTAHPGGTLHFHDSPDFSGEFEAIKFQGDIGSVGCETLLMYALRWFEEGELWITADVKRNRE